MITAINARLSNCRPSTRLYDVLNDHRPIQIGSLWPELAAVLTWTGGSCRTALDAVDKHLPDACRVVELGYRASESVFTVNLDATTNQCLPLLRDVAFEFAEREAWEVGGSSFRDLHDLRTGAEYYVVVTTAAGLYRYDMNDVVRVTGWIGSTPTLEFVRKGRGVTSITGEKLSEEDLIAAVRSVSNQWSLSSPFYVALADEVAARYELYLELEAPPAPDAVARLAEAIDQELRARNMEYEAKRSSGRLQRLSANILRRGAGAHVHAEAVRRGQREAQVKPVCLHRKADWSVDLSDFVMAVD